MNPRRASTRSTRQSMAGVTLLELLIVVVVVAVLGLIGMPSYRQYTMRAHRTEAKTALLRLATNEERFYLQNHRYGATADLTDPILGFGNPAVSERGTYAITVVANASTYTATATPTAGGAIDMSGDTDCQSFSIDSVGLRTAVPDNPNSPCW